MRVENKKVFPASGMRKSMLFGVRNCPMQNKRETHQNNLQAARPSGKLNKRKNRAYMYLFIKNLVGYKPSDVNEAKHLRVSKRIFGTVKSRSIIH